MNNLYLETSQGNLKLIKSQDIETIKKYFNITIPKTTYVPSSVLPEEERCCTEISAIYLNPISKVRLDDIVDKGLFDDMINMFKLFPDLSIETESFTVTYSSDLITKDNVTEKEIEFSLRTNKNLANIKMYQNEKDNKYYVPKNTSDIMSLCYKIILFNMTAKTIRLKFDTMVSIDLTKVITI